MAEQLDRTLTLQAALGDLSAPPVRAFTRRGRLYPAPLHRRLAAFGLDRLVSVVLLADAFVVAAIVARLSGRGVVDGPLLLAALGGYALSEVAVQSAFHGSPRGATPGKRALGLAVVGGTGAPISRRRAAARAFAMVATALTFGLGLRHAGYTGQALHDRIAGTAVVEVEP